MCNTQQKHTNLTQVAVVTWSAIGSWISFAAIWVTSDILSFKTSRLNSTMHRFQTWFHTRNFLSQNFKGNYHVQKTLPGIPVVNQTHPIKTSQSISHNMNFCIVFISLWGSIVQRLGYMLEDPGFKSWQKCFHSLQCSCFICSQKQTDRDQHNRIE